MRPAVAAESPLSLDAGQRQEVVFHEVGDGLGVLALAFLGVPLALGEFFGRLLFRRRLIGSVQADRGADDPRKQHHHHHSCRHTPQEPTPPLLLGQHSGAHSLHLRLPGALLRTPTQLRHLGRQHACIGRTLGLLCRQTSLRQRHQFRLRAAGVQPGEGIVQVRPRSELEDLIRARSQERRAARQQVTKDRPQAEDVAAAIHLVDGPDSLLRRHVRRRAQHAALSRLVDDWRLSAGLRREGRRGFALVHHLRVAD